MTTEKTNWREAFATLAKEICHATSLAPDKAIPAVAPDAPLRFAFRLDNVDFEAVHAPIANAPDADARLHLTARLGKLPDEATWHYERALKTNYFLAQAHGSMLAVDPTGWLVYSIHLGLPEAKDAGAFLKNLEQVAKHALEWRDLSAHAPSHPSQTAQSPAQPAPVMPLEPDTGKQPCLHRAKLLKLLSDLPAQHDMKWLDDKPMPPSITDSPRIELTLHFGKPQRFKVVHWSDPSIAHLCLIECEFGAPPADRASKSLLRLLQLNYEVAPLRTSAFSIDPASGHVVHGFPMLLEHTTARSLIWTMDMLAELAFSWRHDQFLPTASSARDQPTQHGVGVAR